MIGVPSTSTSRKSNSTHTYTIHYLTVSAEGLFDGAKFEQYLLENIKVEGKSGNLGEQITISRVEEANELSVMSSEPIAKRYIRSLTKRYLRKSLINVKEWAPLVSVHTAEGNDFVIRYRKDLPLRPCRVCKCSNRREGA